MKPTPEYDQSDKIESLVLPQLKELTDYMKEKRIPYFYYLTSRKVKGEYEHVSESFCPKDLILYDDRIVEYEKVVNGAAKAILTEQNYADTRKGTPEPYDIRKEFKKEKGAELDIIKNECVLFSIPFYFTAAVANHETGTEYMFAYFTPDSMPIDKIKARCEMVGAGARYVKKRLLFS